MARSGSTNALRAPDYFRLDVRVDRTFSLAGEPFVLFGGVQNVTNRRNFAGYEWNRRTNSTEFTEQQGIFFEKLLADLRERPGVQAAVAATNMPGVGVDEWRFAIEGETYEERADYPFAHAVSVSAGFF